VQVVTENVDVKLIGGIGFDATCSLVVLDENFKPLSVSSAGDLCLLSVTLDYR